MKSHNKKLLLAALYAATEHESSYAGCWPDKSPEAKRARRRVKSYQKIRAKIATNIPL